MPIHSRHDVLLLEVTNGCQDMSRWFQDQHTGPQVLTHSEPLLEKSPVAALCELAGCCYGGFEMGKTCSVQPILVAKDAALSAMPTKINQAS